MNRIAIKMLRADRGKYWGLVSAIAFSAFLLSHQISMFLGILERTTSQITDVVDGDIWVMDPASEYFDETSGLQERDLFQVRSVPGVLWASRFHKSIALCKAPGGRFRQVILLGVDEATLAGVPRKMRLGSWRNLLQSESIMMDEAGWRSFFGKPPLRAGVSFEINGCRADLAAISDASPPFQTFPVVVAKFSHAARWSAVPKPLTFVLAKAAPGVSPEEVCRRIGEATRLKALPTRSFADATIAYYLKHTGIPANFGIVVLVAILVGTVVSGQTFYIFALEHLRHFAALKAIGLTNRQLTRMILLQAGHAGLLGSALGLAMTSGFFLCTQRVPDLRGFRTYWPVLIASGAVILAIVAAASFLSIRRVRQTDPASIFRT